MSYDNITEEPTPGNTTGLLATLRRLVATFTEILHTRVELLSTELEEEAERLRQLAIVGLLSVFFLGLGVVVATAFFVVLFWEPYRLYVLAAFAIVYLAIGVGTALLVRHKLKSRPRLLAATRSELSKDRQQLASSS